MHTCNSKPVIVRCVVPISGGKDSQAALELALREFPAAQVRGFFCDTKFEHPYTYKHVAWMAEHYGIVIDSACGGSVLEKSIKYGRFPGGGARHCTNELKIKLTKKYCMWLALLQGSGFEVWYGMRRAESSARAKRYAGKISQDLYPPHLIMPSTYPQYLEKMGVMFRLPIIDWSEDDVLDLLDGRENILYRYGFERVGCFPCLASGDTHKERAFQFDEVGQQHLIAVIDVSHQIGKPIWSSKGGRERNAGLGCAVCSI